VNKFTYNSEMQLLEFVSADCTGIFLFCRVILIDFHYWLWWNTAIHCFRQYKWTQLPCQHIDCPSCTLRNTA